MTSKMATSSASTVLNIPELLEMILLRCQLRDLLFAQGVCTMGRDVIRDTESLQRALFFQQATEQVAIFQSVFQPVKRSHIFGECLGFENEDGAVVNCSGDGRRVFEGQFSLMDSVDQMNDLDPNMPKCRPFLIPVLLEVFLVPRGLLRYRVRSTHLLRPRHQEQYGSHTRRAISRSLVATDVDLPATARVCTHARSGRQEWA